MTINRNDSLIRIFKTLVVGTTGGTYTQMFLTVLWRFWLGFCLNDTLFSPTFACGAFVCVWLSVSIEH